MGKVCSNGRRPVSPPFLRHAIRGCFVFTIVLAFSANLLSAALFDEYDYRMRIRFTGYGKNETLTNFPALVIIHTNLTGFSYRQFCASANGGDLRFWDVDKSTQLSYEIEKWNTNENGRSFVWVQVRELSGTNTCVWATWHHGSFTNPASCTTNGATWAQEYSAVWHLGEKSGLYRDSTSNHYDGAASNNPVQGVEGQVADCVSLDGTSQYIDFDTRGGDIVEDQPAYTASLWVYHKTDSANMDGFMAADQQNPYPFAIRRAATWQYMHNNNGLNTPQLPQLGVWENISVTFDSSKGRTVYLDGILSTNDNYTAAVQAGSNRLYLGLDWTPGGGRYAPVNLDEARISLVTRSSNWVWACYMNQASNIIFNSHDPVVHILRGTVITIR